LSYEIISADLRLGCMSSAVWSGQLNIDFAHSCTDTTDRTITIKDALKRIGYLGTKEVSFAASPLSAHFEIVSSI